MLSRRDAAAAGRRLLRAGPARLALRRPGATSRSAGAVHGPGAIIDLRCAGSDGDALVRMVAVRGPEVAADARSLGTGPVSIEVFDRRTVATDFTVEDLDAEVAGYEPTGPALEGQLEHPGTYAVTWEKRRCYKLVVRPKSGAAFTAKHVKFTCNSETLMSGAGPGRRGPGALSNPGCQEATRKMQLHMSASGHGGFVAQLYSRPASATEMNTVAAETRRAYREASAAANQSVSDACTSCARERGQCRTSGRGDCEREWLTCVKGHAFARNDANAYEVCH